MTLRFAVGLGAVLLAGPVAAQQFYGMEHDPQVMGALNQMAQGLGQACQMGDQQACMGWQYVQDLGGHMYNASQACLQGYQDGCMAYQQAYMQLDADYGQFMTAFSPQMQAQPAPGVNPLGDTHEQRMQNIQDWGQQILQQGQANSAIMDQRHEQFMQTLRE